jgi:pyruvate dehydrogenase E2 component (dihydrolipoamide acetyltransferase)
METYRGLAVRSVRKLNRVQKMMMQGMKASVNELALSQVSRELDFAALQAFRQQQPVPLNTLLMAAVSRSLVDHPLLNAQLVGDEVIAFDAVNLGMAVAGEAGLVVAVLHNAHQLDLAELDERIRAVVERIRSGKIRLEDIEGGTFTVSNLGMYGIDAGVPIPRPPESAILLLGAVRPRPVVQDDCITVRPTAWATLSFDHRFIDGAAAAGFLADLQTRLNTPGSL